MSDITLDIFDGDAFKNATLSSWVNINAPFVPGLLGSMPSMFQAEGVNTTDVLFDEENGSLKMIPSSPRGAAPASSINSKGTARKVPTVRLAQEAPLLADQVANVRVIGEVGVLKTAQDLVYSRIQGPFGLKQGMSLTLEHIYLGAIDGQVYDSDGATLLWDFFQIYGVSRPAAVNIPYSTTTTDGAVVATALTAAKRASVRAMNGMMLGASIPVLLCGDNYYDAAWGCKEVVNARKTGALGNKDALAQISNNNAFDSFIFNKVAFVNYRGTDDGTVGIPTDEARFFYAGVPGLFATFFAPADTWEFINTKGLPSYLIQRRERQTESQRTFELQSNPLAICTRPKHVQRFTKS